MYREDPEVITLQEQLRQNQRADSLKAAAAMETENGESPAEKRKRRRRKSLKGQ